jgi:hypothetical protein
MPDAAIYILLACLLVLAGFSAYRVSRSVHFAVSKSAGSWAWAASIPAFILCFAVFTVTMAAVLGMFFGR